MSIPDSSNQGTPLLKRFDVYTVLLGLSFLAIIASIALLALEMQRYQWDIKAVNTSNVGAALQSPPVNTTAASTTTVNAPQAVADGSVAGLNN
ncbi:MAG: hypothetical protein JSS27_17080 [Planctomycetes bacterium]|nr:hypothetical protein [Planctomycetota bacterium]